MPSTLSITLRFTCLLAGLLSLTLTGCEEETVIPPLAVCTPVLDSISPDEGPASGGTDVTLSGLWVSTDLGERDVKVFLGGNEALVTSVFRGDGCSVCDACIEQVLRCTECERVCRGVDAFEDTLTGETHEPTACEEWVAFTTPPANAVGVADLVLTNSRGSEGGLQFLYSGPLGDDDDSAGDDDDSAGDDDDSALVAPSVEVSLADGEDLTFPDTALGDTYAVDIVIQNTGGPHPSGDLRSFGASLNSSSSVFALSGPTVGVLANDGSPVVLTLSFSPTAIQQYNTSLIVTHDGANPSPIVLAFSGTGSAAAAR